LDVSKRTVLPFSVTTSDEELGLSWPRTRPDMCPNKSLALIRCTMVSVAPLDA
jgi:hypothetical protein